jgi:hypothetical protein
VNGYWRETSKKKSKIKTRTAQKPKHAAPGRLLFVSYAQVVTLFAASVTVVTQCASSQVWLVVLPF